MQLMVGQLWESTTGGDTGTEERIVRIVHLVHAEDGLQATFVESFIVGNKGKAFNKRFYLRPYLWEYGGIVGIVTAQSMHLAAPVIIIVRLWLNKRIERIYYLAIPYNYYTNTTNTASFVVCRFKIYRCKVFHLS